MTNRLKALRARRKFAIKLGLEMPDEYRYATDEELLRVCNGIGNESMWPWLRKATTFIFRLLLVCADIHDFRFEYSDGTKKSWRYANREMKRNNRTVIRFYYPLVFGKYIRSMWWRAKAVAVDIALRTKYGFKAWQEAHDSFIQKVKGKDD